METTLETTLMGTIQERTLMLTTVIKTLVMQMAKILMLKSQMMTAVEVVLRLLFLFYFYSLLLQVEHIGTFTFEKTKMMKMAHFGRDRKSVV